MVLLPCRFGSVLVEVAGRDEVVLPAHHAAQAGKEAFGLGRVMAI